MEIMLGNKLLNINPADSIAKGGEADIFRINQDQVLKLYKTERHPDLAGMKAEQDVARLRLQEHQQKLPALMKKKLPASTVGPDKLATSKKQISGYVMKFIEGSNTLLTYSDMNFKRGIPFELLMEILVKLRSAVSALHKAGLIIGDFNDLNVLVQNRDVYLIDVDSYQFDQWPSYVFTQRFLDPLLARIDQNGVYLNQHYNTDADWYAYTIMVMQTLLSAGPYSGVTNKKNSKGRRMKFHERVDNRVTIYDDSVGYPRNALPRDHVPDDLNHYLYEVFVKDKRGEFPLKLLQFRWQECSTCGIWHARPTCPGCAKPAPASIKQTVQVRGNVTATTIFRTKGHILFADLSSGNELQYLYHESGEFKREFGTLLKAPLDPLYRFRLQNKRTLIGRKDRLAVINPDGKINHMSVDSFGNLSMFDANNSIFWIKSGKLLKEHPMGSQQIGEVLPNQTLFWVGKQKGLGFYNAGNINICFMFNPNGVGIRDNLDPLQIRGQLVDSTVLFGSDTIWTLYSVQEQSRIINRCKVYGFDGKVLAEDQTELGDDSWLGNIRGKTLLGNRLLSVTPHGIVKVNAKTGLSTETEFPDTKPFVHSGCHLMISPDGLYVVDRQDIRLLKIK